MRVTISKAEDGTLTVRMKRTRREEVRVPPASGLTMETLGATLATMTAEMRKNMPGLEPGAP